jgi:apolipoprotein N-acyltransferase
VSLLLAAGAGVLLSAALPPTGVWPAALALTILFALVSHAERPREAFALGAAFALGFYTLYILWLPLSFGDPNMLGPFFWLLYPLLLAVLAVMWGLVTGLASLVAGRGGSVLVVLPFFWTLMEWGRTQGYFGFPWGTLGYLWLETPVGQAAEVVGVTGLSLLTAAAAAALAAPFAARGSHRLARDGFGASRVVAPVAAVVVVALTWWWGSEALREPVGPTPLTALLVQPNVDPFARAASAARELEIHTAVTAIGRGAMAAPPDLVVWPEGAVIGFELEGAAGLYARERIQESAPESLFVVGGRGRGRGGGTNSAFSLAGGELLDRYDKHVLVPFGERWPLLESAAPLYRTAFGLLNLPLLQNTAAGEAARPLMTGVGPVAATICYESVFPDVTATMVREGARVIVTITNDAWFARGNGAPQHFDMGRMRAIETRRFILRSANDGITGAVDPYGRVIAELPRGVSSQVPVRFGLREELTPFVRYGMWWPHALAALAVMSATGAVLRRRT